jgi:hypothetical protein
MSGKQPLPGNTPVADEKLDNGDWSARALEAVRVALEGQDVPKDGRCFAQSNPDGHEASALPSADYRSIERQEPLPPWASGLIASTRDRFSASTAEPPRPRWYWPLFVAAVATAFGLGWTAGMGHYGHAHLNSTSVSSPSAFTTPPSPDIASDLSPDVTSKSRPFVLGRRTVSERASTKKVEIASQKDDRESATPSIPLPAQVPASSGIRNRIEPVTRGKLKRTPTPDTRPTTIEGWTIREVRGSTALLEGPNGTREVAVGDTVPGLGRIESIVRWGNRWIVATSNGLVTTP